MRTIDLTFEKCYQALRRYQLRELTSVMDGEAGGWSSRRVRCALATIKGMLVEEAQQV